MSELPASVFEEFEPHDKKIRKQRRRIQLARTALFFICCWATYVTLLIIFADRVFFVQPAITLLYVVFYFLTKKWPAIFFLLAAALWAWNVFYTCIERFIILTTSYYRDEITAVSDTYKVAYVTFSIELILKLSALTILLIGIIAAIRYRQLLNTPIRK